MAATTLYLVRHGRTRANLEGRFAGRTGEPLLEEGVEQARAAARLLAGCAISAIYTSPMLRTHETARIVGEVTGAPVFEDPGLSEIFIPQWDGRLKDELLKDKAVGYGVWKEKPERFHLPGSERLLDVIARASLCTGAIMARHKGESAVAVTHLAIIRCLVIHYSSMPLSAYRSIIVKNAAPLALVQKNDHYYTINPVD